jgi:hypothetical protein
MSARYACLKRLGSLRKAAVFLVCVFLIGVIDSDEALAVIVPLPPKDASAPYSALVGIQDRANEIESVLIQPRLIFSGYVPRLRVHNKEMVIYNHIVQIFRFSDVNYEAANVVVSKGPQRPERVFWRNQLCRDITFHNRCLRAPDVDKHVRYLRPIVYDITQNNFWSVIGDKCFVSEVNRLSRETSLMAACAPKCVSKSGDKTAETADIGPL